MSKSVWSQIDALIKEHPRPKWGEDCYVCDGSGQTTDPRDETIWDCGACQGLGVL